jgi:metal-responsive CopG/Arc/MetJ family transcriptional regulator
MGAKKLAISLPEDVLDQVDRAAEELELTRSGYIARVLTHVARARTDAEIRSRVDALFSDPDIVREQRETARATSAALHHREAEW